MNLLKASKYSKAVYDDQFENLIKHEDSDAEMAIIPINDTEITIAFRGTESINDWFHNLQSSKICLFNKEKCLKDAKIQKVKVHKGFYTQYQGLLKYIINYMTEHKEIKKIYTVGHSLGGALACIAAVHLPIRFKDIITECYTFGCPRVGNRTFKRVFGKLVAKSVRAVYSDDIVPSVPSWWRGYRHCGEEMQFEDPDEKESFIAWLRPSFISDHGIDNYIEAIAAMDKEKIDE